MKKWTWLILFGVTVVVGAVYLINRSKESESKKISEDSRVESQDNSGQPRLVTPPTVAPPPSGGLPEARRGNGLTPPPYIPPPANGPDAGYGTGDPGAPVPPPIYDNIPPPPSQNFQDMPPPPFIPPEPGDIPDTYDNDPQYVPTEPLDGDLPPPGEEYE